jgi:hypothetical protein
VRLWVIDTGSIIEIRRGVPRVVRNRVLAELDGRATAGYLLYPPEVLGELERAAEEVKSKGQPDLPLAWARKHEANGTRYGHLLDDAKKVLARIPSLIDPDKISIDGTDDADPHVIALALFVQAEGHEVRIVTEDSTTTPRKTALTDAAGVFGIGCGEVQDVLDQRGDLGRQRGRLVDLPANPRLLYEGTPWPVAAVRAQPIRPDVRGSKPAVTPVPRDGRD